MYVFCFNNNTYNLITLVSKYDYEYILLNRLEEPQLFMNLLNITVFLFQPHFIDCSNCFCFNMNKVRFIFSRAVITVNSMLWELRFSIPNFIIFFVSDSTSCNRRNICRYKVLVVPWHSNKTSKISL